MDADAVLAAVAETLKKPGTWCQHAISKAVGDKMQQCLLGLVGWHACTHRSEDEAFAYYDARDRLWSVLPDDDKALFRKPAELSTWNDWPGRTQEQVLELVERARKAP